MLVELLLSSTSPKTDSNPLHGFPGILTYSYLVIPSLWDLAPTQNNPS